MSFLWTALQPCQRTGLVCFVCCTNVERAPEFTLHRCWFRRLDGSKYVDFFLILFYWSNGALSISWIETDVNLVPWPTSLWPATAAAMFTDLWVPNSSNPSQNPIKIKASDTNCMICFAASIHKTIPFDLSFGVFSTWQERWHSRPCLESWSALLHCFWPPPWYLPPWRLEHGPLWRLSMWFKGRNQHPMDLRR